jgi:hypothetical protein
VRARDARGRDRVLSTKGSISRSHKSLMTHPVALVAKVPNTITPTNDSGGLPSAAKKTAQRAGIIKMSFPAGLSHMQRQSLKLWLDKETAHGNIAQRG